MEGNREYKSDALIMPQHAGEVFDLFLCDAEAVHPWQEYLWQITGEDPNAPVCSAL